MKLDEPYSDENIFAKILRGDMPSVKLYEDDMTYSFMDVMPQAEGHALVIPKSPAVNLLTLEAAYAQALILTTQKIASAVQKGLDAPGIMLVQLNGASAGQTVPHIHFHIIPRQQGLELKFHARDMEDMDRLEAIAAKIRPHI